MGKFFTTIIILAGIIAGGLLIRERIVDDKAKANPFIDAIRELITKQSEDQKLLDVEDPWFADEGRFFKILSLMNETRRAKYSLEDTVLSASTSGSGIKAGEAKMIANSMMESYEIAERLGVFKEPNNLLLLERGEAPVASAKGWEDEKLAVGHRISPLLAPEAARSLVNLTLMPEAMRDMQGLNVTGFTTDTIKKWRVENLITNESAEAIARIVAPTKVY